MRNGKKGALELSVNTIIIIVIGVTLLTLGLLFVRNIFTQTTDLSQTAFENANRELDALGGNINEFLTISPETVRVKAGDYSGFVAKVTTQQEALNKGVKCVFNDDTTTKNVRTPLNTGAEDRFNLRVETGRESIGAFGCEFSLNGGGIEQSTYSIRRDITVIVS